MRHRTRELLVGNPPRMLNALAQPSGGDSASIAAQGVQQLPLMRSSASSPTLRIERATAEIVVAD